jgi:hypothetical protein
MRNCLPALFGLVVCFGLPGCKDQSDPVVYTIPAENATPPPSASPTAPVMDMARQQLPESALNQQGDNPAWQVPGSWEIVSASAMRKASFAAPGSAGPVDIAVTSFPGDVGGLLANLNRWRGQIGAPALTEATLENSIERLTVNGKPVVLTRITGAGQSTHAAIFEHEGYSWFFKMTGPTPSVDEQAGAFAKYINSVDFANAY